MTTRRLLLITYVFPPFGGIPVQRALNFARYLPDHDIEVHVLTARNAASPIRDESLLKRIPSTVAVHRAFTPEPPFYFRKKVWEALTRGRGESGASAPRKNSQAARAPAGGLKSAITGRVKEWLTPDPQVLWKPFALAAAERIIRRAGIDTVMVTAPPFSLFLIGNELKRRFPAIRLISDFRDEWIRFQLADFAFHAAGNARARAEAIERATIECSDLVLTVTQASLDEIHSRHPHQDRGKFALIPNGYDPEAMCLVTPRPHSLPGRMVLTHMGTAYTTASPKYFLDAFDRLPPSLRERLEVRFIGRVAETETALFADRRFTIRQLGFMPQTQAWDLAAETDYFLLTMTNDFSLPGKLFEYMAMGRPVLALSPPGGEVDVLLRETRTGWCVPHDDPGAIAGLIESAWRRLETGAASFEPDIARIRDYERPRLAARLAALLRQ